MDDQTRRLVQHDDMRVLVNNVKRDGFGQDVADLSFRKIERDVLIEFYFISRLFGLVVNERASVLDQGLNTVSGDMRFIVADKNIQPLTDVLFSDRVGDERHGIREQT